MLADTPVCEESSTTDLGTAFEQHVMAHRGNQQFALGYPETKWLNVIRNRAGGDPKLQTLTDELLKLLANPQVAGLQGSGEQDASSSEIVQTASDTEMTDIDAKASVYEQLIASIKESAALSTRVSPADALITSAADEYEYRMLAEHSVGPEILDLVPEHGRFIEVGEALQRCSGLDQRAVDGEMIRRDEGFDTRLVRTASTDFAAIARSSRGSRLFENTVASHFGSSMASPTKQRDKRSVSGRSITAFRTN